MQLRLRSLLILSLPILFVGFAVQANDATPSITAEELKQRVDAGTAPLIVDVRTPQEFKSGHIPGAVNIPSNEIRSGSRKVESDRGVAMYCNHGKRAKLGQESVLASGVKEVFNLEGGLAEWKKAGFPLEGEWLGLQINQAVPK